MLDAKLHPFAVGKPVEWPGGIGILWVFLQEVFTEELLNFGGRWIKGVEREV